MPYTKDGTGWQSTDTSRAAAAGVTPKAPRLRDLVLQAMKAASGPVSTEWIASRVGHGYASVQPRISELHRDGLVRDSGARGKTSAGRTCVLWEIVKSG